MYAVLEGAGCARKWVKALSGIIDEGVFVFAGDGVHLTAVDPSKIAMVQLYVPAHAFNEYSTEGTVRAGLKLKDLEGVLKKAKSGDVLRTEYSGGDHRFHLWLEGRAKRSFRVPVVDVPVTDLGTPGFSHTAHVKVLAEVLREAVDDAELFSSHVTFSADSSSFAVRSTSVNGEYGLDLVAGEHDALLDISATQPARATYPLDYLQDMLSQVNKSTAVRVSFSTDTPLELAYSIGDAEFRFLLAPRIENT